MLPNSESVKEHIVLGTYSQAPPDLIHISHNAVAIDQGRPRGGRVQTLWDGEQDNVTEQVRAAT